MSVARTDPASRRRLSIPAGVRLGGAVIAFGLVFDIAEHGFATVASVTGSTGDIPIGQHAAHLIVLVGMVLILAAIVGDGLRSSGRMRPEGSPSDAIR